VIALEQGTVSDVENMGTDIRAFIEYRSGFGNIWFPHAEVLPERDYRVFGAIAGVRYGESPMLQPRGFPRDASASAELAYFVRVADDDEAIAEALYPFVRTREASRIVARGGHYRDEKRDYVSHPDAKFPSWLSGSELLAALASAEIAPESSGLEWQL